MSDHRIEPELLGETPRRVVDRTGIGCGLAGTRLFILPHTIAGVAFIGFAVIRSVLWTAVLIGGTQLDAVVIEKETRTSRKGDSFALKYAYEVAGETIHDEIGVDANVYQNFEKGGRLPLRLVTWAPKWGHWPQIEGYVPLWEAAKIWLIAALWNGALSVFLWQLYVVPLMQRRLLAHGVPVIGVVCGREPGWRGGWQVKVTFEYTARLIDGGSRTVRDSTTVEAARVQGWKAGDAITVLHDPSHPTWNVVYRLASYQIADPRWPGEG